MQYSVTKLSKRADEYDTGLASHQVSYQRIDQPLTNQAALWNALVVHGDHPTDCGVGDGDTSTDYSLHFVSAEIISIDFSIWTY